MPWDPTNPTAPHYAYAGATVTLGATAPNIATSTDAFTFQWNFGDGTSLGPVTSTSTSPYGPYNLGTTHVYSGAVGKLYTATITVTDTVTKETGSNSYLVEIFANNLTSRVNIAIDSGLWFLHVTMGRENSPANGQPVNTGGWDGFAGCPPGSQTSSVNICIGAGGLDATNVQAFEVKGHLENGPASDPYTDDVARGLARMMAFLIPESTTYEGTKTFSYNPANMAVRCSDGTEPTSYGPPAVCGGTAKPINYNPGATSCTTAPTTPCNFTYDINGNGQLIVTGNDSFGDPGYQMGMFVDALVATANPTGVAKAGPTGVVGQTYKNIVTDIVDAIGYCEFSGDYEETDGVDNGGAWQYNCAGGTSLPNYNDNSPSQWDAIGLIAANRGFGIPIMPIIKDANQIWLTWSQEPPAQASTLNGSGLQSGISPNKIANNDSIVGAFGYDEWGYEPWGPWADTPSGMVQMSLDGVGRTASGATDQRWNWAESLYHDNFCNGEIYSPDTSYYSSDSVFAPRWYMYGLFSFTKAMLEHSPGGVLTPINFLEDVPAGTNSIDWYGALSPANGGTDPCDGVAQTLVSRQQSDGSWYYYSYYTYQMPFDTAWAVIMLNKTVFVQCISNLYGRGTPGNAAKPPRVDLTWSPQTNATGYNVLRGTTTGGPYTMVGTTTSTAFSDTKAGLVNGDTYYYVVQPLISGTGICQSNEAVVKVP
ncbi:MAG: hypothetical protein ACLPWF_20315 [Bryobacteraceae bacterium]